MSDSLIPIQMFQPKFRKQEILTEISECLDKGWTGMGYKTNEFETLWSDYTGLPNSHFISSNTVGLHLALKIFKEELNWKKGDEIITTPLTFVSTNHAIMYENLTPVFADVDSSLCLDPESIIGNINDRTRAILYVGIGGNTGKLDKVKNICKKYNLKLILDAAHMSGTKVLKDNSEVHVGFEADVCIFSFQAVKNLPTADSGMVCFKSKRLDLLSRKYSWLGIDKDTYSRTNRKGNYSWKYDVPHIGFKYHGNSIMASIAKVQLKYLDPDNIRRNEIAEIYENEINNISSVESIKISTYCSFSSRHLFQIYLKDDRITREAVMDNFYKNKIFPGVHYIDNTNYPMYSNSKGICKNASFFSKRIISLPLHLNLTNDDVLRVCEILREGIKKYG